MRSARLPNRKELDAASTPPMAAVADAADVAAADRAIISPLQRLRPTLPVALFGQLLLGVVFLEIRGWV